jgi:plastocyanin
MERRRVAAALIVVAACGAGVGVAGAASTRTVKVTDNVYSPKRLTVKKGTKVVWSFRGAIPHNVDVASGPELFSSRILKSGTFAKRLTRRGTYRIVCTLHEADMTMKVVVR